MSPLFEKTYMLSLDGEGVPAPLRRLYEAHGRRPGPSGRPRIGLVHFHAGPDYHETGEVLAWVVGKADTYLKTPVHTLVFRPSPRDGEPRWEYVRRTPKQRAPRSCSFGWYAVENWSAAAGLDPSLVDLEIDDVLTEPQ